MQTGTRSVIDEALHQRDERVRREQRHVIGNTIMRGIANAAAEGKPYNEEVAKALHAVAEVLVKS